jgi:hypothetical protein
MTDTAKDRGTDPVAATGSRRILGLAERAVATHRAAPGDREVSPAWRARAARAVRILAATLGVDPAHVVAVPDSVRSYGLMAISEVRLTVADTQDGDANFTFVPEYGTTDAFVLLASCPGCSRQVPMYRVVSLADLGRHLELGAVDPDVEQFASDPAHAPGCRWFREDIRYATAYRPPPQRPQAGQTASRQRPEPAPHSCGCACATGDWCGGCGHAGCSRR